MDLPDIGSMVLVTGMAVAFIPLSYLYLTESWKAGTSVLNRTLATVVFGVNLLFLLPGLFRLFVWMLTV